MVCNLWGTPASFAAIIDKVPAFGVCEWTINGFSFLNNLYSCQTAFKSFQGVIFRDISMATVRMPSLSFTNASSLLFPFEATPITS